jgi:hypothetical protein
VATPITTYLVRTFQTFPEYLGRSDEVLLITKEGRQFAQVGDSLREVVVATASDVATFNGLFEGVYVVGTGSTGAAVTLLALGAGYFLAMALSAVSYRTPPPNYTPAGWTQKQLEW